VFNIKVRKGREQTCQQVMHRLVAIANATKWSKLVTRAVSRDVRGMSWLSRPRCVLHNGVSAFSSLRLEEEVVIALQTFEGLYFRDALKQEEMRVLPSGIRRNYVFLASSIVTIPESGDTLLYPPISRKLKS
jgi:hypothetical protein